MPDEKYRVYPEDTDGRESEISENLAIQQTSGRTFNMAALNKIDPISKKKSEKKQIKTHLDMQRGASLMVRADDRKEVSL